MKKTFTLIASLILLFNISQAKIWRVNNTVNFIANFTTISAAITAAAAGDTIYVEGSGTPYGVFSLNKRLTIQGPGYFLSENNYTQVNNNTATISGTVNSIGAGAENSIIQGLSFNVNGGTALVINCSNLIIRNNNFANTGGGLRNYYYGQISINSIVSNIIIEQNFGCNIGVSTTTSTGILIQNNVMGQGDGFGNTAGGNCVSIATSAGVSSSVIVKNNVFKNGGVLLGSNTNCSNNIMYAGFVNAVLGSLVSNNIGNSTQFGTANGNLSNISMATVFDGTGDWDSFYQLKAGSPAFGAGFGSTPQNPVDCGIFSGSHSYVLSGLPSIPYVYFFSNQPIGSNSDPIDVTIKVKSNN